MRKTCRLLSVGLVCLGLALPAPAEKTGPGGVEFTWALAAFRGAGIDGTWVELADDDSAVEGNKLGAGDKLKMMVEVLRPCFVYVLRHDAEDRLHLLFPAALPHPSEAVEPRRRHFVPAEGAWLGLGDTPGEETFFVIAAGERLVDLEGLLARYLAAEAGDARDRLLESTLDRIAELQAQHHEQASTLRKPASIGGAVRSMTRATEITKYAEDISAGDFFSATYTIQHQR